MEERREFVVGFRGELTDDDEQALARAGFTVHRDAMATGGTWYSGTQDAQPFEGRHVVTMVFASDPSDAISQVADALGRELEDPLAGV